MNKTEGYSKSSILINTLFLSINVKGNDSCDNNLLRNHRPIKINGNDDFKLRNGVKKGSGTINDPYIISDWEIKSIFRPAISISNTDAFVIIKNCRITGLKFLKTGPVAGIYIKNAKNIKIEETKIECLSANFGIALVSSSNNKIEKCNFKNLKRGITINGCPDGYKGFSNNNTIEKSSFNDCDDGIYFCCLPSSKNNVISFCNISHNKRGICLDHCIHYTTITNCNISRNNIGLTIVSASSNNYISNNIFYKNNVSASDNCRNKWNINYWEGHNSSKPYDINGNGQNRDKYPLKNDKLKKNIVSFFKHSPRTIFTGEEVVFDGSLSYDCEKNISSYTWKIEKENHIQGKKIYYKFKKSGRYNVTLNVSNNNKYDSFSKIINIYEKSNNVTFIDKNSCIQGAINISKPGDTLIIENGTYYENLFIDTPNLNIIGRENTIIDGRKIDDVIKINSSFVNISNIKIINSSKEKSGIRLGNPDYIIDSYQCNINNNTFEKNQVDISLFESEKNHIENNLLLNNSEKGIFLIRSFENIIRGNHISNKDIAIKTEYASNWNKIQRNKIKNNDIGIYLENSNFNYIFYNNIKENRIGVKLNRGIKISGSNI